MASNEIVLELSQYFKTILQSGSFADFLKLATPSMQLLNIKDVNGLIELTIYTVVTDLVKGEADISLVERTFQLSLDAALCDKAQASFPVYLLGHLFDSSTISECESYFKFVESRAEVLKQEKFFKACKNHLLKVCNDLMKRLSRSQKTIFCGRILLFLSNIFPISERSGLNVVSEFNIDNTTVYNTDDDSFNDLASESTEVLEDGEMLDTQKPIIADKTLYQKFWGLQDYFRNPNLCYNKLKWKSFTNCTSDVLTVFRSFKSDDPNTSKWKQAETSSAGASVYFAKYLTSPKLLELELSDSHFRRYVLVQFLIHFQYLSSPVRFKLETYVLSEDQLNWVKETTTEIYRLLGETPPNGEKFSRDVKGTLKREEMWNTWKNEGCPDHKAPTDKSDIEKRCMKRPGEDYIQKYKSKKNMPDLIKQWSTPQNNWEACQSSKRMYVPTLETFFNIQDGATEMVSMVKKKEVSEKFTWKALRLLNMKSTHLFLPHNGREVDVSGYLASTIEKLAKEKPQIENRKKPQDTLEDTLDDENDEFLAEEESASTSKDSMTEEEKTSKEIQKKSVLTKALIDAVGEKLQNDWKAVIGHMGFQEDEIEYFETTFKGVERMQQILSVWMDRDGNLPKFMKILQECNMNNVIANIRS